MEYIQHIYLIVTNCPFPYSYKPIKEAVGFKTFTSQWTRVFPHGKWEFGPRKISAIGTLWIISQGYQTALEKSHTSHEVEQSSLVL